MKKFEILQELAKHDREIWSGQNYLGKQHQSTCSTRAVTKLQFLKDTTSAMCDKGTPLLGEHWLYARHCANHFMTICFILPITQLFKYSYYSPHTNKNIGIGRFNNWSKIPKPLPVGWHHGTVVKGKTPRVYMTWLKDVSPLTSSVTASGSPTHFVTSACSAKQWNSRILLPFKLRLEAKEIQINVSLPPKGKASQVACFYPSCNRSPFSWRGAETRKPELQQLLCSQENQKPHSRDDRSAKQEILGSWCFSWADLPALVYCRSSFHIMI